MKTIYKSTLLALMCLAMTSYGAEYEAASKLQFPVELLPNDSAKVQIYLENQIAIVLSAENIVRARNLLGDQGERLADEMKAISANRIGGSSTISIQCTSTDPVLCANYANALASAYIDWHQATFTNSISQPIVIQKAQAAGPPKPTYLRMFE